MCAACQRQLCHLLTRCHMGHPVQDGNNILYGTGDDAFLKGIRIWLKARQYSTSTTEQLWQALSSAVGRNVGTWMRGWSYESGFPLVRVTLGGIANRDISISQV